MQFNVSSYAVQFDVFSATLSQLKYIDYIALTDG
jgi:hypothetical protein